MIRTKRRKVDLKKRLLVLAIAAWTGSSGVSAFELDVGGSALSARWDNKLKYSAGWRVNDQDSDLIEGAASPNHDDGNRNFDRGLISNRIDLFTEFDLIYQRQYGFRLSAAGWYDHVYNSSNDHDSPETANNVSVPYNRFNSETEEVHGRKAEMLDWFVFGGVDVGDTRLNVRAGSHSLLWGESLFFGINGIAGAMAPVDVIKLSSVPGTQFKEAIRPVPQVSAQWQLNNNVSVGAFYQFAWEENRLPAAGSYFSGLDFQPAGGETFINPAGLPAAERNSDQKAQDSGQGGLQLNFSAFDTYFGLYAVRFHSKNPQQVNNLAGITSGFPYPESYQLVYHEGITAYGASASRSMGALQLSIEGSVRHDQDLASTKAVDPGPSFGMPITTDNDDNPAYAIGKTAHINVSTIWTLPSSPLAREANLTGEIMWNRVLSVDENPQAIDPNSTRDAAALRLLLEPVYRQVRPGLDLVVPIGIGYSPKGSRSRVLGPALPPEGGGDLSIGLNGTYLNAWNFTASYTHYFGSDAPILVGAPPAFSYKQHMKDRDFVSFSVSRSF